MKILVIGSEGFMGKSFCSYFTSSNHTVFKADIIDKQETNYYKVASDSDSFSCLFTDEQYDVCINASGSGSVAFSNTNPSKDYKLNTLNVFLILEAIRNYNPNCKFINFSSAAVYGNSVHFPIIENQELKPMSPYGWHKLMSETICKEFYTQFKIPTLSLRVFSVYGPGLKKQLFWDLYQKTLTISDIKMEGTGDETRDFIFINDLCVALDKVLLNVNFNGDVINIASGEKTSIRKATELLLNKLNDNLKVTFNNHVRLGDPMHYHADIAKLKSIGFSPEYSIEKGVDEYVSWLQEKK